MKRQHTDYLVVSYPRVGRFLEAAFRTTHQKPMIHGEVDVSTVRELLREQFSSVHRHLLCPLDSGRPSSFVRSLSQTVTNVAVRNAVTAVLWGGRPPLLAGRLR